MSGLVVADLYGRLDVGHSTQYNDLVISAALEAGVDSELWHVQTPAPTRGWSHRSRAFCTDGHCCALQALISALSQPGSDVTHVLLHTLSLQDTEHGIEHLLDLELGESSLSLHTVLRFDPRDLTQTVRAGWLDSLARLRRQSPTGRSRLAFYSDTEPLADAWAALLGRSVRLLPIPVRLDELAPAAVGRTGGGAVVLFAGDARPEKGFEDLPRVIREVALATADPPRWSVQANLNLPEGQGHVVDAATELLALAGLGVDLVTEPLLYRDYTRRLHDADVVLLPYDGPAYERRSSGVLMEALLAGKPIVTVQGSWMADMVTRFGAGIVTSRSSLASGVVEALATRDILAQQIGRSQDQFKALTSPDSLVQCILHPSEDGRVPRTPIRTGSLPTSTVLMAWSTVGFQLRGPQASLLDSVVSVDGQPQPPGTREDLGTTARVSWDLAPGKADGPYRHLVVSGLRGPVSWSLVERMSIDELWEFTDTRDEVHAPERAADGRHFAWTARPAARLTIPMPRGSESTALEVVLHQSPGAGQVLDIAVSGLPASATTVSAGGGRIMIALPEGRPVVPALQVLVHAAQFGPASPEDHRMVGVALEAVIVRSHGDWNIDDASTCARER